MRRQEKKTLFYVGATDAGQEGSRLQPVGRMQYEGLTTTQTYFKIVPTFAEINGDRLVSYNNRVVLMWRIMDRDV
jgi:hypothetical protein